MTESQAPAGREGRPTGTGPPGEAATAVTRVGSGRTTDRAEPSAAERAQATWMGLLALALWSATIPLARLLSEALGTTTSASAMLLIGGGLGLAHLASQGSLGALQRLRGRYLLGCGGLFVGYMVCLYLAIGLAGSRAQVVEVGILNYLWPTFTLLLAVPMTGVRVRAWFWPAVLVALGGAALAPLSHADGAFDALWDRWLRNPWPYPLAFAGAVSWALYSVLSRRWAADERRGAVPLFTFAAGLALGGMRLLRPETSHLTAATVGLLALMALFPVLVAYAFWDRAVRRGNLPLVAAASYGVPVVSTLLSQWLLDAPVGVWLWIACGLVTVGAVAAQRAVKPDRAADPAPPAEAAA